MNNSNYTIFGRLNYTTLTTEYYCTVIINTTQIVKLITRNEAKLFLKIKLANYQLTSESV